MTLKPLFESTFAGRKTLQPLFERLHLLALKGMNYRGRGSALSISGELWVIDWFRKGWKQGRPPVLFDVGANIGDYARAFHKAFGGTCTIHRFEPSAPTFRKLQEAVTGLNIKSHCVALSSHEGTAILYADPKDSSISSPYDRDGTLYDRDGTEFKNAFDATEAVSLCTLDGFCSSRGIGRIDFLKLDVEGHELEVLRGASQLLRERRINTVQFEFGVCDIDSRVFFRDFYQLLAPQYSLYRICQDGLYPLPPYGHRLEIFRPSNFLAILRNQGSPGSPCHAPE